MKRSLAALVAIVALVCSGTALAAQAPDKTVNAKKQFIDFRDAEITGTVRVPEISYVPVRLDPKFTNRLTKRGDFLPELAKSVDSL